MPAAAPRLGADRHHSAPVRARMNSGIPSAHMQRVRTSAPQERMREQALKGHSRLSQAVLAAGYVLALLRCIGAPSAVALTLSKFSSVAASWVTMVVNLTGAVGRTRLTFARNLPHFADFCRTWSMLTKFVKFGRNSTERGPCSTKFVPNIGRTWPISARSWPIPARFGQTRPHCCPSSSNFDQHLPNLVRVGPTFWPTPALLVRA